ncbi:MAG: 2-oxoacid:acceptor oxidoreductase subunit alpha [Thermodesulfobacteriota bacterium]
MTTQALNILIGGEAGQGLATIGQVLAKCLVRAGYFIVVTQDYMSRVRGGHNTFMIRVGPEPIAAPREGVDLLVALDRETLELHRGELRPGAQVVADTGLACSEAACFNAPYAELTQPRYLNSVALGLAAALIGLDLELVDAGLKEFLGKKKPQEVLDKNREALENAYRFAGEHRPAFAPLAPARPGPRRMIINGNEALGLGFLAGGLKFLAFYPMTPSTSIAQTVIAHAHDLGVVCEQAEDEIAAINMALGASYAGAPALVTTSGGGFALMVEGLSLAGISETPIVVALAQRPGPATGLPTRTEQGDLEFALHAGHGEFPRAILAPGSVQDCFVLAAQALALAEASQGPVILLTDQFLADSYRALEPFDLDAVTPVKAGARDLPDPAAYRRYAPGGEHGLSPRALPGQSAALVVSDSDEHTAQGHITEDAAVRVEQHEKRLAKLGLLVEKTLPPVFEGPEDAELLLLGWGSSRGAIAEAAALLTAEGRSVATCHFRQLWPLRADQFLPRLNKARQVVMVESNATGQMARLIRRETGFETPRLVLRYDGRPLTPEYILRALAQ